MKIGFFITARLKSTRLKNKILLDLNGKTVLERVIERCKSLNGIDGVVLATSTNSKDSVLHSLARSNQIQFFRGSEDDVLLRLEAAATQYGYDAFLSITADNPLFSLESSQIIMEILRNKEADFVFSKGLPMGCNVYGIESLALRVANHMKKATDTEIWGPFVNRSDFFNIKEILIKDAPYDERKRLTLDYSEDYELLLKLFKAHDSLQIPSTKQILSYLEQYPFLLEINSNRQQRFPSKEEIQEIESIFNTQIESGKIFSSSIGKILKPGHELIRVSF